MVIKGLEFLSKVGNMAKKPAMDLIKNSRLPSRWKKYFQGETLGEAKIKPIAKSSRSTVPYEISAFIKGGGTTLSLAAIYSYLTSEKKDSMRKMAEATGIKSAPKSKPKKKVSNVGKNPPQGKGMRRITVQKGDNLSKISKRAETTIANIKRLNPNIKDVNKIKTGQRIIVRGN